MTEVTHEQRDELKRLAEAALSDEEWGKDRTVDDFVPAELGRPATVLYDDGDHCADVYDNMGLGLDGDRFAAFWAKMTPIAALALLRDLEAAERRAERAEKRLRELDAAVKDYIDARGLKHEGWECPEDDTCSCPRIQRMNTALLGETP